MRGAQGQVRYLLIERRSNEFCAGVTTFDLGQNMAGWCRLKFTGPPGFGTSIRHGETLVAPVVSTK
jgi:hypothetical protein